MSTQAIPPWFMLGTAGVVLTLFAVSYVVDMFSANYEVPPGVYGLVTIVVGSIVGSEAVKGIRK